MKNVIVRGLSALVIVLTLASPVQAQADVVATVKASLQARGVSLADSCGAFEVTRRVAWQLRATGAGLLDKPSGNQCQGRAVDIIVYPDGRAVDILSDAGGVNGPTWNEIEPVEASRWRQPTDPGDSAPPSTGQPPVIVQAPAVDLSGVLVAIGQVRRDIGVPGDDSQYLQMERVYGDLAAKLEEVNRKADALAAQLKQHDESPTFMGKLFGSRYTQILMGAAAAWFTAQQTTK